MEFARIPRGECEITFPIGQPYQGLYFEISIKLIFKTDSTTKSTKGIVDIIDITGPSNKLTIIPHVGSSGYSKNQVFVTAKQVSEKMFLGSDIKTMVGEGGKYIEVLLPGEFRAWRKHPYIFFDNLFSVVELLKKWTNQVYATLQNQNKAAT